MNPVITLCGTKVHLNQLVTQHKGDFDQHFIVVGITDGGVLLNDADFDGTVFEVTAKSWKENDYRAEYVVSESTDGVQTGIPVWGY